jgi:hypothetical protein
MTIDVRGTATIECSCCGNENTFDISHFFNKYGFDTAKWGQDGWHLACNNCDYSISISDGICVIESEGE